MATRHPQATEIATTVSPTYAREISGHPAVAPHLGKLYGIRNGACHCVSNHGCFLCFLSVHHAPTLRPGTWCAHSVYFAPLAARHLQLGVILNPRLVHVPAPQALTGSLSSSAHASYPLPSPHAFCCVLMIEVFFTFIFAGIDTEIWDPAGDRFLPVQFGPDDLVKGKRHSAFLYSTS